MNINQSIDRLFPPSSVPIKEGHNPVKPSCAQNTLSCESLPIATEATHKSLYQLTIKATPESELMQVGEDRFRGTKRYSDNPIDVKNRKVFIKEKPPAFSPDSHTTKYPEPVAQIAHPPGKLYFVNNENEKHAVIDSYRQKHSEPSRVLYIRNMGDLSRSELIDHVRMINNKVVKGTGLAYLDQPLTVILDLREFTPAEIASINDFLQPEAFLNGQRCNHNIQRVIFANDDMLTGVKSASPDLHRRLESMQRQPLPCLNTLTDQELLQQRVDNFSDDKPSLTVDFTTTEDWFSLLFGRIRLSETGGIQFQDGILANLNGCQQLILKNAPWQNPDFVQTLATALREGRFKTYGKEVILPKNLAILKTKITKDELNEIIKTECADQRQFDPNKTTLLLNQYSLTALQGDYCLEKLETVDENTEKAIAVGKGRVPSLVSNTDQLVITGKLTDHQWLWLLHQIKALPGNKPLLFRDLSKGLYQQISTPAGIKETEKNSDDPYNYWLNSTDSVESILQKIAMSSQNSGEFTCNDTELMKCLKNGKPVIFHGIENHPKMNGLESLLARPSPYVLIQGRKIMLPHARVTFIRAEKTTSSALELSPVIASVIKPCHNPPCTTILYPAVHKIYDALLCLPPSPTNSYPPRPPWSPEAFISLFLKQKEIEKKMGDGVSLKESDYDYRALKVLVAKMYRRDSEAYGFLKWVLVDTFNPLLESEFIDYSSLIQWLEKHEKLTINEIKNNFWHLRSYFTRKTEFDRYFPVKFNDSPTDRSIYLLLTCMGDIIPRSCESLKNKLEALRNAISVKSMFLVKPYPGIYSKIAFSSLRNALRLTKNQLKDSSDIYSILTHHWSSSGNNIRRILDFDNDEDKTKKITSIRKLLSDLYINEQLPDQLQDLPQALVNGQRHKYTCQQGRLLKLSHRIDDTPVVFLQGEAGVGKTFMAGEVAKLRGQPLKTIQFGPHTTMEQLMGWQKLTKAIEKKPSGEEQVVDHYTKFEQGELLKWLNNENPELLLLDEANLASEALLKALLGTLKNDPPVICYQGEVYKLTDKHRIILTGNPDCYPGRHSWVIAQQGVPIFYYHPMDSQTIKEDIIKPELPATWPDDLKNHACEATFALYKNYQELFPDETLTPRDLKDLLATLKQIMKHRQGNENITKEMVNALVWKAFADCLAGALDAGNQSHIETVRQNYHKQFHPADERILRGVKDAATRFTDRLQQNNRNADFSSKKTRELCYHYWQFLDKDESGRKAQLIEGPAGWGKDFVLNKVLKQWQMDKGIAYEHLNANPNQWDFLVESIRHAMNTGYVIAISELNLIPSRYLEGQLNTMLTEPANAGFKMIATINPVNFSGRSPLSDALKNRFSRYTLSTFSREEMVTMLARIPKINPGLPNWLADQMDQLSKRLEMYNSPVRLSRSGALRLVETLSEHPQADWLPIFNESCYLARRSLDLLEANDKQSKRSTPWIKGKPGRVGSGAQTSLDGVFSFRLDGDVTASADHILDRLFSSHWLHPGDYRYQLFKLQFSEASVTPLWLKSNGQIQAPERALRPWPENHETLALATDEVMGKYSVEADGRWHALPGITSGDKLTMLHPENTFNIGFDPLTNQWLVQSKEQKEQSPEQDRWITTDFVMEPHYHVLEDLQSSECLSIQSDNGHLLEDNVRQKIKAALFDEKRTEPNCIELRRIDALPNAKEKILALKKLFQSFKYDKNVTGEGLDLLINMIKEGQGVCRHRCWCFQLLCEYWDIPCRIVSNQCHEYLEVSFDGGKTWYRVELGGSRGENDTEKILNTDFFKHIGGTESESVKRWWHSLSCGTSGNGGAFSSDERPEVLHCLENNQIMTDDFLEELKVEVLMYWLDQEQAHPGKYQRLLWATLLRIYTHSGFFRYYSGEHDFQSLLDRTISLIHLLGRPQCLYYRDIKESLSRLSENNIEDKRYLEWLLQLCEQHCHIRPVIFSVMARYLREFGDVPYGDLMRENLQKHVSIKLKFMDYQDSTGGTNQPNQKLRGIIQELPNSKKLKNLLGDISIDRCYVSTPKENTEIDVVRLASKQPCFVEKQVRHQTRPVILDMCGSDIGIVKKIKKRRSSNNICVVTIYQLFIAWLLHHGDQKNIHYLYKNYDERLLLDTPESVLTDNFSQCIVKMEIDSGIYLDGLPLSAESIRKFFQSPEAVILQYDTLLPLLDEFLEHLSGAGAL